MAQDLKPFNFTHQRTPELGELIAARGAAWLIYPTVICAWLYLAILAGTQLVLGQRAGAWVAWQVFPLALAMVLVVGGCRLLISLLQRKDVVPTLFGGSERSHDASHAADAVATVS